MYELISLTCYRLLDVIDGEAATRLRDFVDEEYEERVTETGPIPFTDFEASIFVVTSRTHQPGWAGFIRSGFPDIGFLDVTSTGALVVLKLNDNTDGYFAFAFGTLGRYMLRMDGTHHGYGLRTAINLIYPKASDDSGRLVSVDATRRGESIIRSRRQANLESTIETFGVDRLRDVLTAATGSPSRHRNWGTRITGGDALHFTAPVSFDELGVVCRRVEEARMRTDYRERFAWLDNVQPVTDPDLETQLETEVLAKLQDRQLDQLVIAPPEISRIGRESRRRLSDYYEAHRADTHPDLRLIDVLAGIEQREGAGALDGKLLRQKKIHAIDGSGDRVASWAIWRCISGAVVLDGNTYILDEASFFRVDPSYLNELNAELDLLPETTLQLPPSRDPVMREREQNPDAALRAG